MRQLLFLFLLTIAVSQCKAQVSFCPAGARWRYTFPSLNFTYPTFFEPIDIMRVQDSIVNNEIVKVIRYRYFFVNRQSDCDNKMLIKQKGDTVFMRNCHTNNTWQILYNFAAAAGQSWTTTIFNSPGFGNAPITHTVMVDAISYQPFHGDSLKKMQVTYCYPDTNGLQCYGATVTERFGGSVYLFNYFNLTSKDAHPYFYALFCYEDSSYTVPQSTSISAFSCDYNLGIASIQLNEAGVKIYPQPADEWLIIETGGSASDFQLKLTDISGRIIESKLSLAGNKMQVDMSKLEQGVYLLQFFERDKFLSTQKILKR